MTRAQLTDEEWEFIEPHLPIGEYGPYYPRTLRQQFEGMIWRFRTGVQRREMSSEFGAWSTVSNRSRQWRDAEEFQALLEDLIAEAAKRREVDLYRVGIDSTTTRAHHDAAGMHLGQEARRPGGPHRPGEDRRRRGEGPPEGAAPKSKADTRPKQPPSGRNDDESAAGGSSA
ncbi:transposase [Streptomyces sp. A1547]|uniref:transposase n=1 Tax=Streptomyces sp. A1547 TaxID=2563105 RepID=UPI00109E3A27|nr:transposase [Streptomyces sp. A1547]THA39930.1 transposase [Streptomyces sp. A1547]